MSVNEVSDRAGTGQARQSAFLVCLLLCTSGGLTGCLNTWSADTNFELTSSSKCDPVGKAHQANQPIQAVLDWRVALADTAPETGLGGWPAPNALHARFILRVTGNISPTAIECDAAAGSLQWKGRVVVEEHYVPQFAPVTPNTCTPTVEFNVTVSAKSTDLDCSTAGQLVLKQVHRRAAIFRIQRASAIKKGTPPSKGDAPSSKGDAPSSKGDAPSSKGDAPSSKGDAPSSKGDAPPAKADAPPAKADAPPAKADAPPSK